ncbi:NADPH-adrenodoxin reductase Arh1, partial [Penicillium brevicompactum]
MRSHQLFVRAQCTVRLSRRPALQPRICLAQWSPKRFNSRAAQSEQPPRVAVIGSGPAGFYSAYRLLGKRDDILIDMYEKLPVPFGLSRYGVAPDHPEVKNCEDKFVEVASSSNFNFIGNIEVGHDLPLAALKPHYDAILFSYGATKDKELGIPGEDTLDNVHAARAFVGWYNGHPEHRDLDPDLSGETAVIVGQGNVALDVARILLSDVSSLAKTDIAEYAVEKLSQSRIKRVHVVGRRGPLQAAFTIKEAREMLQLPGVSFDSIPKDIFPPDSVISGLPRAQKRIMQLLAKGSNNDPKTSPKSWSLDFLLAPESLHGSPEHPNHISHVKFSRNELDPSDPHTPSSKVLPKNLPTGERDQVDIPASVFFRSVGYKSLPVPGLEDLGVDFDTQRGILPNDGFGRITSLTNKGKPEDLPDGSLISQLPGLYCAGWVKRGPTGVIASTMTDAFTTADSMVHDLAQSGDSKSLLHPPGQSSGLGWDGVKAEAQRLGLHPTSWEDWLQIDKEEKKRGEVLGKPRSKLEFPD